MAASPQAQAGHGDGIRLNRRQSPKRSFSMPTFHHDDLDIAFLDEGEGDPILLIHGFASSKEINWVQPGWVDTLTKAGYRVIALDNRGHGASSKLYDSER